MQIVLCLLSKHYEAQIVADNKQRYNNYMLYV